MQINIQMMIFVTLSGFSCLDLWTEALQSEVVTRKYYAVIRRMTKTKNEPNHDSTVRSHQENDVDFQTQKSEINPVYVRPDNYYKPRTFPPSSPSKNRIEQYNPEKKYKFQTKNLFPKRDRVILGRKKPVNAPYMNKARPGVNNNRQSMKFSSKSLDDRNSGFSYVDGNMNNYQIEEYKRKMKPLSKAESYWGSANNNGRMIRAGLGYRINKIDTNQMGEDQPRSSYGGGQTGNSAGSGNNVGGGTRRGGGSCGGKSMQSANKGENKGGQSGGGCSKRKGGGQTIEPKPYGAQETQTMISKKAGASDGYPTDEGGDIGGYGNKQMPATEGYSNGGEETGQSSGYGGGGGGGQMKQTGEYKGNGGVQSSQSSGYESGGGKAEQSEAGYGGGNEMKYGNYEGGGEDSLKTYFMDVMGKTFNFEYEVDDPKTNNFHSHRETDDGKVATGSYSWRDPKGNLRIVDYIADHVTGFRAIVRDDKGQSEWGFSSDMGDDDAYGGGGAYGGEAENGYGTGNTNEGGNMYGGGGNLNGNKGSEGSNVGGNSYGGGNMGGNGNSGNADGGGGNAGKGNNGGGKMSAGGYTPGNNYGSSGMTAGSNKGGGGNYGEGSMGGNSYGGSVNAGGYPSDSNNGGGEVEESSGNKYK